MTTAIAERAAIPDAEIAAAYTSALALATATARGRGGHEFAETLRDAATDGVMKALDTFQPGRGEFRHFCRAVVQLRVRRAMARAARARDRRPTIGELPDDLAGRDLPAAGEVPLPDSVKDLPSELRDAVRFYFVDGFSMDECSLLMGCCKITVRNRLYEAAAALAPDRVTIPFRRKGEKRLQKG